VNEFQLIARYFTRPAPSARLGVGDDAALLAASEGCELAVSTDMLVAGTHFLSDTGPQDLGHKVLAVNLSDLAAMGARPRWALLAMALPEVNESWIAAFARGFFALAEQHGVDLVGGDTTRGSMNFCVTVMGELPQGKALLRSGARAGDDVWVSGAPGEAALGLAALQGRVVLAAEHRAQCLARLQRPTPRIELGLALRGLASAAIDVSDGLLADLGHILERSAVSTEIDLPSLPLTPALAACPDHALARQCLLAGGDDYELCFTAPREVKQKILALGERLALPLTPVGRILAGRAEDARVLDEDGRPMQFARKGFDHFSERG